MKQITTTTRKGKSIYFEDEEWMVICAFLDLCASYLREVEGVETLPEDEIMALAKGKSLTEIRPDRLAALGGFAEGALLINLDMRGELDWIWTDGVHLCLRHDSQDMDETIVEVSKVLQFIKTLFVARDILIEEVAYEYGRIYEDTCGEEVLI